MSGFSAWRLHTAEESPAKHGRRLAMTLAVSLVVGLLSAISAPSYAIPTYYTLTYTANAGGTISGTTPQTVQKNFDGESVTAVPNLGYHFVDWSDSSTANPRTDTNVTSDITVAANFAINTYTLTYTAGTGGTISGTSPQTVNYGESGTAVVAVPNIGHHFLKWSDDVMTETRTDTTVTADLNVTANFAIDTFTVTYLAGTHGSITGTTPQTVNYGDTGTAVTATPDTGYHFVMWSDSSTANPRTDTNVMANLTVTASFAIDTFTLTYTAGTGGSITGTSPQTVNYGESGTAVTAVPNAGYHFDQWSDSSTANPRIDTNVAANVNVTGLFALSESHTVTYSVCSPTPHGFINDTATVLVVQVVQWDGTSTPVTAVPEAGYVFWTWNDDYRAATRSDAHVKSNLEFCAQFWKDDNVYTLTYLAGAGGTISGVSTQVVPKNHNGAMVTAVANPGYHFVKWSDDVLTASRTDTDVKDNATYTAIFQAETYTLTYTAGAGGTISGTSPQTVGYGGSGTAVTAVANAGYHFVNWSDASTANPRTDTNVMANLSVTANFAANVNIVLPMYYVLVYVAGPNGSITGNLRQTLLAGLNGESVTAVANAGYHFVNWSDGLLTATRTDKNVLANQIYTANFAADVVPPIAQAPLTLTANPLKTTVGTTSQLTAQGGSGTGAITFATSTPGMCAITAAGVVSGLGAGICIVTATKAADSKYLQATSPEVRIEFLPLTLPVVPKTTKEQVMTSVYFAANSSKLTATGLKAIATLVRKAKALVNDGYMYATVLVKGYVQPTRSKTNDKSLSTARAKVVAAQLRKLGIGGTITVRGMGRAVETTPAGRRADAVITLTITR